MVWSEMFKTGNVPDDITEKEAHAEAYGAWAICHAGQKMPDQAIFGKVMAELATRFKSIADIHRNLVKG